MLLRRLFLGFLSAGLCYTGLAPTIPQPEMNKHTPVAAAERSPEGRTPDETFTAAVTSFSGEMTKKCAELNEGKNMILSPLSAIYALTLCSNGASGETLAEFEALNGKIPVADMNEYLYAYADQLAQTQESTVRTANSLWGNKEYFTLAEDFRTVSEAYYNAESSSVSFADPATRDLINGWVSEKTDGLIPEAIDELDPSITLMILNTVLFDGQWQEQYEEKQIRESVFTNADGSELSTDFMYSTEHTYFEVDGGAGFSKMYKDGYAFTAVLPDGDLDTFLAGMDLSAVTSAALNGSSRVEVSIPKFEYESEIGLNEVLQAMGLQRAFSGQAELFGLSENGLPLYIDKVLQKAKIITNERGTKAAAMTEISMKMMSVGPLHRKVIHLDRPFFYMILDTETGIPLFTGAIYNMGE